MRKSPSNRRGIALVITLSILMVITILVVGLSLIMTLERSSARNDFDGQRAHRMADLARDHATALLRDSIDAGRVTGKFWSSQPGRITVFDNATGTVSSSTDLSTGTSTLLGLVDLNKPTFKGTYPIASAASVDAASAPPMQVSWVNVLSNPAAVAAAGNPVVGRYAFWVDDESSKINVNTADGTSKYVAPLPTAAASPAPVSYGNGVPTEVNLQALKFNAGTDALSQAKAIATATGIRPGNSILQTFTSLGDLARITDINGKSPDIIDNNFDLTAYNRSPELNIFGEPKIYMALVGNSQSPNPDSSNLLSYATMYNFETGAYTTPIPYPGAAYHYGTPLRQIYPASNPIINLDQATFQQTGEPGKNGASTVSLVANNTGVGNQLPEFVVNSAALNADNTFAYAPAAGGKISLPQYFSFEQGVDGRFDSTSTNYNLGLRIAQYLKGYNSQGQAIQWPKFPGSGTTGFAGKYTDRQIDSITLQILDLVAKDSQPDNVYNFTTPSIMAHGFLSGQPVAGLSHGPHPCEILATFTMNPPASINGQSVPSLAVGFTILWYWPREYQNTTVGCPGWDYAHGTNMGGYLNVNDFPMWGDNTNPPPPLGTGTQPLGWNENSPAALPYFVGAPSSSTLHNNYWGGQILNATDTTGADAGIDFWGGHSTDMDDPDQYKAGLYHSYLTKLSDGNYPGAGPTVGMYTQPTLGLATGQLASNQPVGSSNLATWDPGDYFCTNSDDSRQLLTKAGVTGIHLSGGFTIWATDGSTHDLGPVPIDGYVGPNTSGDPLDATTQGLINISTVLNSTITLPSPGIDLVPNQSKSVLWKVADPLVNNFPGDWQAKLSPDPAADYPEMVAGPDGYQVKYKNGASSNFLYEGGGDPSAYWAPPINQNVPKIARFPSVGYLQYVRTGLMPDKSDTSPSIFPASGSGPSAAQFLAQHGTPFRLFNLAPSTAASQQTAGGTSYPDWAMLDLFTVPVTLQPLGSGAFPGTKWPGYLEETYGGSTPGRVNPNSALSIAPFSNSVTRARPLQAVFKGVRVSNSYQSASGLTPNTPLYTGVDLPAIDEVALSTAVSNYMATVNRPLMVPGEIANVPEVAAYLFNPKVTPTQPNQSRNDLVCQTVGNLTTQSNVFTVWAVGQSIKKRTGNSNYGTVESGDIVAGETRTKYTVERYIDLGKDGVVGNGSSSKAGADGIVGTQDDIVDTATGFNPVMTYPLPYKYRIVSSEEITN